jgi:hypothetical protein
MELDVKKVKAAAVAELAEARFRKAVEAEKQRLLTKKVWWHKLFPFVITIQRRK